MDQLTSKDAVRFKKLKKEAESDMIKFRAKAHRSAEEYPREMRRILKRTNTRDTSTYLLLTEWTRRLAPEVDAIQAARTSKPFRNALAKHLNLSNLVATDLAKELVDERLVYINKSFLNLCYGPGKARTAALNLLCHPSEEVIAIRDRFVEHHIHRLVASELGIAFHDPHAPLLKRLYLKTAVKRQTNKFAKRQAKRLEAIASRQQEIKASNQAIISRILSLEIDTTATFEAYKKYKNQLDKLPTDKSTPAKRLSLFTSSTKKIREAHTSKQSTTKKLADIQDSLKALDNLLIELFDMTDAQHDAITIRLKEYQDLEREKGRILKQQAAYADKLKSAD